MTDTLKDLFGGSGSGKPPSVPITTDIAGVVSPPEEAPPPKPDPSPRKVKQEGKAPSSKTRRTRSSSRKPQASHKDRFFDLLAAQLVVMGHSLTKTEIKKMSAEELHTLATRNGVAFFTHIPNLNHDQGNNRGRQVCPFCNPPS